MQKYNASIIIAFAILLWTILAMFGSGYAKAGYTIVVVKDGSGEFISIQDAVNIADNGDTVLVMPGTYNESVIFTGKNIVLTSLDPNDSQIVHTTTIEPLTGLSIPTAIQFQGGEEPNCVLKGLNLKGCIYGIQCQFVFDSNGYPQYTCTLPTHATISHCLVAGIPYGDNRAIANCDGLIEDCLVADNRNTCLCGIQPAVVNCHGIIRDCTIVDGQGIQINDGGSVTIQNCITSICASNYSTINVEYSNLLAVWGGGGYNFGAGVISNDPCFVRYGQWAPEHSYYIEGDYHLKVDSPCINAGNPNFIPEPNETDLDGLPRIIGGRVDIGAYEFASDTTPPELKLSVTPNVLWPPNHKMVKITPSWTVKDDGDSSPEASLVGVTCNDKNAANNDIQITKDGSIYLRAEKGMVYTITYKACDESGNCTTQSTTVTVPHDNRK